MRFVKVLPTLAMMAVTCMTFAASAQDLRPQPRPADTAAAEVALVQTTATPPAQRPRARPEGLRLAAAPAALQATVSTRNAPASTHAVQPALLRQRTQLAVQNAQAKRARGQRVWCVPFARDASGVQIRGDARTWWSQAAGQYHRSHTPEVGAVMNFAPTKKMRRGHVAVVSRIVNSRQILISHANWTRNQVSLDMVAVDVSPRNDWSQVRLEHRRGQMTSTTYPIYGFIHPTRG